jgi:hypothetical protein
MRLQVSLSLLLSYFPICSSFSAITMLSYFLPQSWLQSGFVVVNVIFLPLDIDLTDNPYRSFKYDGIYYIYTFCNA